MADRFKFNYDPDTGALDTIWEFFDANGVLHDPALIHDSGTAAFNIAFADANANCNEPVTAKICLIDVGTVAGTLTPFIRLVSYDQATGDVTQEDRTNDLTAAYTVTGTATPPNEVGNDATWRQGRIVLTGGTWSPGVLTRSYAVDVRSVGNTLNPPTFTDSFGNVTALLAGESFNYSDGAIVDPSVVVNSPSGLDEIVITYINHQ